MLWREATVFLLKSGVDIHPLQWFPLLMELSSIISGSPSWNFATSKQKANPWFAVNIVEVTPHALCCVIPWAGLVRLTVGDDTWISFGRRMEVWNSFHRGWWMFARYQKLHHSWQVFVRWDGSMGRWLQWKMGAFLKRKMEKSKSQLSKMPRRSSRSSQNVFLKLIDPQLMQPLNTGFIISKSVGTPATVGDFTLGTLCPLKQPQKEKWGKKLDHWTCGSEGSQLQNQQQISFRTPQKMDDTTSSMLNFQLMCCNSADVLLPSGFGLSPWGRDSGCQP